MNCKIINKELHLILPITGHTSKVRIKRRTGDLAAEPVFCRSTEILKGDYLEWQISYDTDDTSEPSVVPQVKLNKKNGIRYGCELVWLMKNGLNTGIFTQSRFNQLKLLVNKPLKEGIEESEKIKRVIDKTAKTLATKENFKRYTLNTPNYYKKTNEYEVEIKIAHKQRALGNQAMIFVNLPVAKCQTLSGASFVGRIAQRNESVVYIVNNKNSNLIDDTTRAFAIASVTHRKDLSGIFNKL